MRDCGGCVFFTKIKSMNGNSGLCELYNGRTSEDRGNKCNDFKSLKYNRNNKKYLKEVLAFDKVIE